MKRKRRSGEAKRRRTQVTSEAEGEKARRALDHDVDVGGDAATRATLKALQELSEFDLTTRVLVPLFSAMGYSRTDYFGGPNERGKDLLCWRENELGRTELTAVQAKKARLSARAASKSSLSEILNQLSQALDEPVPGPDGKLYNPSSVYFVTPFPFRARVAESHARGYAVLRQRGVEIIDGQQLVQLLRRYVPELELGIVGLQPAVSRAVRATLNNLDLLRALAVEQLRDLHAFYTDVDLFVGRVSTRLMALPDTTPGARIRYESEAGWERLLQTDTTLRERWGLSVLGAPVETIQRQQEAHDRRQELRRFELARTTASIEALSQDVERAEAEASSQLRRSKSADARLRDLKVRRRTLRNRLTKLEAQASDPVRPMTQPEVEALKETRIELRTMGKLIGAREVDLQEVSHSRVNGLRATLAVTKRHHDELTGESTQMSYAVPLDGRALYERLVVERDKIIGTIGRFNGCRPSREELREFLLATATTFELTDELLTVDALLTALGIETPRRVLTGNGCSRLRVPLHAILDSGLNVAVFGDAGAGKTT